MVMRLAWVLVEGDSTRSLVGFVQKPATLPGETSAVVLADEVNPRTATRPPRRTARPRARGNVGRPQEDFLISLDHPRVVASPTSVPSRDAARYANILPPLRGRTTRKRLALGAFTELG